MRLLIILLILCKILLLCKLISARYVLYTGPMITKTKIQFNITELIEDEHIKPTTDGTITLQFLSKLIPNVYRNECSDLNKLKETVDLNKKCFVPLQGGVFKDYCQQNVTTQTIKIKKFKIVRYGDLIPYSTYHYILRYSTGQEQNRVLSQGLFCTEPARPLMPPQVTDGSFKIISFSKDQMYYDGVKLYWMPVAKILLGYNDTHYNIKCTSHNPRNGTISTFRANINTGPINFNQQVVLEESLDPDQGSIKLSKLSSLADHVCTIVANNSYGTTSESVIRVPRRENLLSSTHLAVQPVKVGAIKYKFRWGRLNSSLQYHKIGYNDPGIYTLHWCQSEGNCNSIDGFYTSNKSGLITNIFPEAQHHRFGISYRNNLGTKYTGINWNDCRERLNQNNITRLKLTIDKVTYSKDLTSMTLDLKLNACNSMYLLVKAYKIVICQVEEVDGCEKPVDEELYYPTGVDFRDTRICRDIWIENPKTGRISIDGLRPGYKNAIKIKFKTVYGQWSQWNVTYIRYNTKCNLFNLGIFMALTFLASLRIGFR